jgi:hypothetical protein
MGIRREYRQRGIDAALIGRCLRAMLVARYERCEISWVLDDNPLMQSVGAMFGGAPYKRYALYEQEIGGSEAPLPPMAPHRSTAPGSDRVVPPSTCARSCAGEAGARLA